MGLGFECDEISELSSLYGAVVGSSIVVSIFCICSILIITKSLSWKRIRYVSQDIMLKSSNSIHQYYKLTQLMCCISNHQFLGWKPSHYPPMPSLLTYCQHCCTLQSSHKLCEQFAIVIVHAFQTVLLNKQQFVIQLLSVFTMTFLVILQSSNISNNNIMGIQTFNCNFWVKKLIQNVLISLWYQFNNPCVNLCTGLH